MRASVTTPSSLGAGWEIFSSEPPEADVIAFGAELVDVHAALRQANALIQTQEERIRNLENMVLTDELTGLSNRRGFLNAFQRELALGRRDTDATGLLVALDLDGFKGVNDTWGHQIGDAYLYAVAETLRENVRTTDVVARLGGDEFAILFTGVNELAGVRRVKRLEKTLSRKVLLPEKIPLRASFGYAAFDGTSNMDAVLQAADARLYAQKRCARRTFLTA